MFEFKTKENNLISKRTKKLLLILFGLLIILNIPFTLTIAPPRQLIIVDKNENPVASATIRQVWYQYALGIRGEERFITKSEGKILLPTRSVRTSLLLLLKGSFNEFRQVGVHASYTSSEYVSVRKDDVVKSFYDGKGLEANRIKLD